MGMSNVIAVEVASAATDVNILDKPCTFYGYALTGAAASNVFFRDDAGTDTAAKKIGEAQIVSASEGDKAWFGPQGVRCNKGLMIDRDGTNAVKGVVYVG